MSLTGQRELIEERGRTLDTIDALSDEEFEHASTLCAGWAPRDILAHLIGTDDVSAYVRAGGRINSANAALVQRGRELSRPELTRLGRAWARRPGAVARAGAHFLLGDVAVHHQDVLRGLGRTRDLPTPVAAAIFREGVLLSTGTPRNLLRHRVLPTTPGGRALGRGRQVRGSTEALGLWLAGRQDVVRELEFAR